MSGSSQKSKKRAMPAKRHRGFSLVEMLAVLLIIASLGAAVVMNSGNSPEKERRIVLNEAKNFSGWIKSRMALAARESVDFKLRAGLDMKNNVFGFSALWLGSGSKGTSSEKYIQLNNDVVFQSEGTKEATFSGRWFTLSPAATFTVKSKVYPNIKYSVTISGTGYVNIQKQ